MFHTAVSSVGPTFQRHIFLRNMESIKIISRKEICRIKRGRQGINRISEATDMAYGRRSGLYQALLRGRGLS